MKTVSEIQRLHAQFADTAFGRVASLAQKPANKPRVVAVVGMYAVLIQRIAAHSASVVLLNFKRVKDFGRNASHPRTPINGMGGTFLGGFSENPIRFNLSLALFYLGALAIGFHSLIGSTGRITGFGPLLYLFLIGLVVGFPSIQLILAGLSKLYGPLFGSERFGQGSLLSNTPYAYPIFAKKGTVK